MGSLWRRSGSFEFDSNGERAPAAKAYFFVGGTTTALTVYQNAELSIAHTIPLVSNGVGRWPEVHVPFLAEYDEQILDASNTQLTYYTGIANVDPTDVSTDVIDVTQIYATGDWKFSDVDETKSGFVRANGRTIGSAASGATERAHADCEDLFLYRWNKLANGQAAVSTGRGASAAADWSANKTIALPDCRGGYPLGLDTMGAAAASVFASTPFTNGSAILPGSLCGLNTHTLTTAQLPTVTPAGTIAYASNFTPAGTNAYASNFTPAGSNAYASNFTPAGSVSTPTGTVTKPTITVADAHTHSGGDLFDAVGFSSIFTAGGATAAATAVNNTAVSNTGAINNNITASLDSTPAFTGNAATFTGTPAALPAATFTGFSFGGGTAHNNVSKAILGSWYLKL